jgi:hypothetical protein
MEVLLAERISDEENPISVVISRLRLVNCANPASAFRHQGQSGIIQLNHRGRGVFTLKIINIF